MHIHSILIAPDSFKGSLTATEAAEAIALGAKDARPEVHAVRMPLSDGGEGVVDILTPALGGMIVECDVSGPLAGQKVKARWGIAKDRSTAIIEMAQAAGLSHVPLNQRDPKATTTFGVGELIQKALDHELTTIIVGIGGSATNDAGAGMAEALGIRLLDENAHSIPRGGAGLLRLHHFIQAFKDPRLKNAEIIVACDVRNPLLGKLGASAVYGPQKGATPADVVLLDQALGRFRDVVLESVGIDVQQIPGSGAAGGLGAGLVAFCGARLRPGIDIVLDALRFDDALEEVDLVITGEGKMDRQTSHGKVIAGVMTRCAKKGVPLAAIAGSIDETPPHEFLNSGFVGVSAIVRGGVTPAIAMRDAFPLLRERSAELVRNLTGTNPGNA